MSTAAPVTEEQARWPVPGATLAARYEVGEVVGRGGHSVIYRGTETGLGREVALKVLDVREGSTDEIEARKKRFYREARLMAQLNAPSTVTMYDYGRTADGLLYLVFEYVDGITLAEWLHRNGHMAPERVKGLLLQTLESLREAHALGFLHRDIKPSNLMLYRRMGQPDGVKVLDFGIATQVDGGRTLEELTLAGEVIGTPRYLAPERIRGEPATEASDVFSLGLVAYELLVGKSPVAHLSGLDVARVLTKERIELPAGLDVDDELRSAVDRMLAPDLDTRFCSVDEVLVALGVRLEHDPDDTAFRSESVVAFPVDFDPLGGTPVDELTGTTTTRSRTLTTKTTLSGITAEPEVTAGATVSAASVEEPVVRPQRSRSWIWLVMIVGCVAAASIAALFLFAGEPDESAAPTEPEPEPIVFEAPDERPEVAPVVERATGDVGRAARFARMAADIEARDRNTTDASPASASKPKSKPAKSKPTSKSRPDKQSEPEPAPLQVEAIDEID